MASQWTRNQKIAVWTIIIPAIIAIIALFIQVHDLNKKIQPVIEMKPQINNVINNIVEVKKEIANLQEMLKQEDALKETEVFTKSDVGIRVKKVNFSDNAIKIGYLIFELKKVPLKNSVLVARPMGAVSPAALIIDKNLVYARFSTVENELKTDTDGYSITYIPDVQAKVLLIIKDATFEYSEKDDGVRYSNVGVLRIQ